MLFLSAAGASMSYAGGQSVNNGTGYQGSGESPRDAEKGKKATHEFSVRDRKTMLISGVSEIISFDENSVVAETSCGEMTVEVTGLHIGALDTDRGFLSLDGEISGIYYLEDQSPVTVNGRKKRGLFGR